MPLTDVVRYLNERDREKRPFPTLEDPFYATVRGAIARYARITLDSAYAPIRYAVDGALYGHAAQLEARGELNGKEMHPDAVFAIPSTNTEYIHLDRLVRTLHALNYLIHANPLRLLLKVNLRHIESVPSGHGQVFEEALRACGLEPDSITLEIAISDVPQPYLQKAIDAYRARGYGIAICRSGYDWHDTAWLNFLRPDIVRFERVLLDRPDRLAELTRHLGEEGIQTLIDVGDERSHVERAQKAGLHLLQYPVSHDSYLDRAVRLQQVDRVLSAPN